MLRRREPSGDGRVPAEDRDDEFGPEVHEHRAAVVRVDVKASVVEVGPAVRGGPGVLSPDPDARRRLELASDKRKHDAQKRHSVYGRSFGWVYIHSAAAFLMGNLSHCIERVPRTQQIRHIGGIPPSGPDPKLTDLLDTITRISASTTYWQSSLLCKKTSGTTSG